MNIVLTGCTDNLIDPNIDAFRIVFSNLLRQMNEELQFKLNIVKRGFYPDAGGKVHLQMGAKPREIHNLDLVDIGKVKRIRGVVSGVKVSS